MKPFFSNAQQLAQLLTDRVPTGKFMNSIDLFEGEEFKGCMKTLEFFMTDIRKNLVSWASEKGSVFYKTQDRWYLAEASPENENLIYVSCFQNGQYNRWDTFANKGTMKSLGKAFLGDNLEKRIPVFG